MKRDELQPRELPHAPEAEHAVLGALMFAPDALHRIADRITASSFFEARHQRIYAAAAELIAAGQAADPVTLWERLRGACEPDEARELLVHLNRLANCVPSAANVAAYADIVADRARRRALIAAADAALAAAWQTEEPAADSLDRMAGIVAALRQQGERGEPQQLGSLMAEVLDSLQRQHEGDSSGAAIPTGFASLDSALAGGLRPGNLFVLGARPSVGKTSLATAVALAVAQAGHAVLMLSLEMRAIDLARRIVAHLASVNLGSVISGRLDREAGDWGAVAQAGDAAARLPLWIDDQAGMTLAAINAKARRHQHTHGLDVLVLDYLQLTAGSDRRENRNLQIEEVSRGLKTLAKDLGCCVIALAQLNRQSLQRAEPDLGDLRDSGAIEQDADTVLLLDPREELGRGVTLVAGILAKNRQGKRGRFALELHGPTQRWRESERDVSRKGAA